MTEGSQRPAGIEHVPRLAATLRVWRRQNNLKQAALAQLVGVSQAAVARWESGADSPSPGHLARLRDLMAQSMRDEFIVQKLFVARQSAIRSFIDFEDMRMVAVSEGFRQLWPESSALLDVPLRDQLVNEAHLIANDPGLRRQILAGGIGLISGASTRQMQLEIDTAIRHRWHICFRRFGLRTYADMVYEPCPQDVAPGISEIVRLDHLPDA